MFEIPPYLMDDVVTIKEFSKSMVRRVKKDMDVFMPVTGSEGSGKSSFAYHIGKACDHKFTLERNELFTPDFKQIKDKVVDLPKYSSIILDEAIKVMYKKRHASQASILLNEFYNLCRRENKITIACIPRFRDLNKFFRAGRAMFWAFIPMRGLAAIYVAESRNPWIEDPWHFRENQKLFRREMRGNAVFASVDVLMPALKKSPNFLTFIKFPDFPDDVKEEYNRLVSAQKYDNLELAEDYGTRYRHNQDLIKHYRYILSKVFMIKNLGELEGITPEAITMSNRNLDEEIKTKTNLWLESNYTIFKQKRGGKRKQNVETPALQHNRGYVAPKESEGVAVDESLGEHVEVGGGA